MSLSNTCISKCVQSKKFVWWLIFFVFPIILSEICFSPSLPVNLTKHLLNGACETFADQVDMFTFKEGGTIGPL